MYAITGITGQVGGAVARILLDQGEAVRAVMRDASKSDAWTARGCEVAIADMVDGAALAKAFANVKGVFLLAPPVFDPAPGFPEVCDVIAALMMALSKARPLRVVCLSSIGAQAYHPNLLSQLGLVERKLSTLNMEITFLRPAWFMENAAGDVESAQEEGVISSFLQPLNRRIPMVATGDVGRVSAELLRESWGGRRIVNLEGPRRVSPLDLAHAFALAIGHPVMAEAVPRETWEPMFKAQGAKNPEPRAQMLDGFNAGWLSFDADGGDPILGLIQVEDVIADLVNRYLLQTDKLADAPVRSARN